MVNMQSKEKKKCYSCGNLVIFPASAQIRITTKLNVGARPAKVLPTVIAPVVVKLKSRKNKNENDQANKAEEKEHSFAFQMKAQQGVTKNNTQMPNKQSG